MKPGTIYWLHDEPHGGDYVRVEVKSVNGDRVTVKPVETNFVPWENVTVAVGDLIPLDER